MLSLGNQPAVTVKHANRKVAAGIQYLRVGGAQHRLTHFLVDKEQAPLNHRCRDFIHDRHPQCAFLAQLIGNGVDRFARDPNDFIGDVRVDNQRWCVPQNVAVGHCARYHAPRKARRGDTSAHFQRRIEPLGRRPIGNKFERGQESGSTHFTNPEDAHRTHRATYVETQDRTCRRVRQCFHS